jgi:hypothetical protein
VGLTTVAVRIDCKWRVTHQAPLQGGRAQGAVREGERTQPVELQHKSDNF